ncbi:MAG: hypothetical protein V1767_06085 [Chloroflexota bacterium]
MEGRRVKRLAILAMAVAILTVAFGCRPVPPAGQQPDDIVPTPGGAAYRANVHQQGIPDFWPPIQITEVVLNVTINYRSQIETRAGESRNNIIFLRIPGRHDLSSLDLNLSVSNIPAGIQVKEGERTGGLPGTIGKVLVIEISRDVKPGEYTFEINVRFERKDYGQLPCTIKVIR